MDCVTNVNIPTPIAEKCQGVYTSTDCIIIPEANVTLDLPINSSQTEVNNAITAALIYKEQQIQQMENDIDLLDGSRVDIFVEGSLGITGIGTEDEPFIVSTTFDISDYQLKNIPNDISIASVLNEGKIRYRTDVNNSYIDMCMKVGVGIYDWINILTNNWL